MRFLIDGTRGPEILSGLSPLPLSVSDIEGDYHDLRKGGRWHVHSKFLLHNSVFIFFIDKFSCTFLVFPCLRLLSDYFSVCLILQEDCSEDCSWLSWMVCESCKGTHRCCLDPWLTYKRYGMKRLITFYPCTFISVWGVTFALTKPMQCFSLVTNSAWKYLPFQYLSLEIRVATPRAEILTEALLCEQESSQEPEQQRDEGRCGTSHRQRLLRILISVVRLGILS